MIRARTFALLAGALLLALSPPIGASLPASSNRAMAPFCALASGHVGEPYQDTVSDSFDSSVSGYALTSGSLPQGLAVFNEQTGVISGRPAAAGTFQLVLAGTTSAGPTLSLRAALTVFTPTESEVVRGQSFATAGPDSVTQLTDTLDWTSSFDQSAQTSNVLIFQPSSPGKHPLLVFHYGRGFVYTDYPSLLTRIASWGIVVATMSDLNSFGGPNTEYDVTRPELGMESASACQEALTDYMLGRNATPGDALVGTIDPDNVFMISGHSRGGGATHASHVRSIELRAKGVIYFYAFDLRYFSDLIAPALAPAYAIPSAQPRLPSLILSAGDDGDLVYPYADEFIDRATGPTTFVTVDGACHDYLSDTHESEDTIFGSPLPTGDIERGPEQTIVAGWAIAFIRRWALPDPSLEALLYEDESAASNTNSVASWRRSAPMILVDDFQGGNPATNALGGANTCAGMTRAVESVYPPLGDLGSLGLEHSVMTFTASAASYSTELGAGTTLDVTSCAAFKMRISSPASIDTTSWAHVTLSPGSGYALGMWVVLHDAQGNDASVKVANEDGTSLGYLPSTPQPGDPTPTTNRFATLTVPLVQFQQANPAIDLAHLARLDLDFAVENYSPQIIAVDDLRFEGGPNPPAPLPVSTLSVVGAASGTTSVAADSIATAYGKGLATTTVAASDGANLSATLGGTTLTVTDSTGTARAAVISYVSPTQVNFVVPDGTALGPATVTVTSAAGSVSGTVPVANVAPGVFSADSSGTGPAAANLITVAPGGAQTDANAAVFNATTNTWSPLPVSVSAPGTQVYLILYATGVRAGASTVSVTVGGVPASVAYAGPQTEFAGLDQVNVLLPPSLAGSGTVPVVLTVEGQVANTVTIAVQ